MLSEKAKVLSAGSGTLKLQTSRRASCSGCSLKSACGQYLLSRDRDQLELNACVLDGDEGMQLQAGDEVVIGLAEGQFLRLTFLFYMLPLLGLLLASLLADRAGYSEAITALAALAGLVGGFAFARLMLSSERVQQVTRPSIRRFTQNGESRV